MRFRLEVGRLAVEIRIEFPPPSGQIIDKGNVVPIEHTDEVSQQGDDAER